MGVKRKGDINPPSFVLLRCLNCDRRHVVTEKWWLHYTKQQPSFLSFMDSIAKCCRAPNMEHTGIHTMVPDDITIWTDKKLDAEVRKHANIRKATA
jgi:hypothetical protein